ncbi:MAG: TolC family protein, partial [Elusimicrobiaceae bacterium]|nr:TolC family protein [Elusimicrobiaceae bacterium]
IIMMKKLICLLYAGLWLCLPLSAQETESPLIEQAQSEAQQALLSLQEETQAPLPSLDSQLSVHDCVRIAMANSPRAVSARLAVESAAISLSNAKNVLLPTLSAGANTGYTNTNLPGKERANETATSSSIDASLSISGITDIGRNIRTQRLQLAQTRMSLCEVENAIVADVKSAYYALMAAQRAVQIRTQSRDLYQDQYNRTKAFFDQGLRPKVDVTTAEVNLNNEILGLIRAKNLVKTQNAKLANVMGVPRDTPFVLDDYIEAEEIDFTFEEALTRAYENRPDVQSSKLGLQIREIKLTQAKAGYWPTFTMGASFSKSGDEFRFDSDQTKLFAGVEIPIFSAFKISNNVKQAKVDLASAQNSDRSLANDVYLEVQNAFIRLNEAAESIPVAASTAERAKENMDLARGRYNEGIGDIITLKDAEVSYTDAELNLLTARFDYAVALAELKKAMGTK